MVDIQGSFAMELKRYRDPPRKGRLPAWIWMVLANMGLSLLIGAILDGWKTRVALSDSSGPSNGCDRKDTMAMPCSAAKIDRRATGDGMVLTLGLSP